MIDLSKFVGKRVRLTLRDGSKRERTVCKSIWNVCGDETFCLSGKPGSPLYSSSGVYLSDPKPYADIVKIEEIKPMNKYEELEKQVAEMQKEIDRLKREEKNYPNLKPVEITRTVKITPEEYYEYCKEYKEKPTATGYVKYYSSSAWFMDSGDYTETFKVIGETK